MWRYVIQNENFNAGILPLRYNTIFLFQDLHMVSYIQLFGERCSGTNFVLSLVTQNFKHVAITTEFGGKHWFLKDHFPRCRANQTTDAECIRSLQENSSDTLFLCVFRNPFDWLRSLHERPYHASNHGGISITQFIRKPWLSFERYPANRHWPQRDDGFWFIEEALNILRLRSMKIEHLLNLRDRVENFYLINYETLLADNEYLTSIANDFEIELNNPTITGEKRYLGRVAGTEFSPTSYPKFPDHDIEYIFQELDWELEQAIGYSQTDYQT
ncbi:MAG: hypothetical protein ACI8P9_001995 [Parasphingorhabdus sp.]|jgi:hypothetical protein